MRITQIFVFLTKDTLKDLYYYNLLFSVKYVMKQRVYNYFESKVFIFQLIPHKV